MEKQLLPIYLKKILSDYGYHTGLMGNNGVKVDSKWYPTDINTQEPQHFNGICK